MKKLHKTLLNLALTGFSIFALSSCAGSLSSAPPAKKFQERADYRKTMETFKDDAVFARANQSNTRVRINLATQRAQLLVGEKREIAIDCPCTTGKSGKRTPTGTFRIMEKIVTKRSNLFGRLYKDGKQVYGGDRRKYKGSYDKYVGSPLPYWMRMTGDGIGMHYSRGVKRYPASNGCIRMPQPAVRQIFSKVRKGTRVEVVSK